MEIEDEKKVDFDSVPCDFRSGFKIRENESIRNLLHQHSVPFRLT